PTLSRCWGVVQLVGHHTVNVDGEGSNPSAPATFLCAVNSQINLQPPRTIRTSGAPATPAAYSTGSARPPTHRTETLALRRASDRGALHRRPAAGSSRLSTHQPDARPATHRRLGSSRARAVRHTRSAAGTRTPETPDSRPRRSNAGGKDRARASTPRLSSWPPRSLQRAADQTRLHARTRPAL